MFPERGSYDKRERPKPIEMESKNQYLGGSVIVELKDFFITSLHSDRLQMEEYSSGNWLGKLEERTVSDSKELLNIEWTHNGSLSQFVCCSHVYFSGLIT